MPVYMINKYIIQRGYMVQSESF